MMKRLIVIFGMVVALAVFMTTVGQADPLSELRLSDGTTTVLVIDNGVGDLNPTNGVILFSGGVGAFWTINTTAGYTYPVVGTIALPSMDLLDSSVFSLNAPALTIEFSQYFLNYPPAVNIPMVFDVGGTGGTLARIDAAAYYESHIYPPSAAYFSKANQIGSTLTFLSPDAFSGSTSGIIPTFDNHFTATEWVRLTPGTAGGNASFNADLHVAPEPATMLLLGLGLMGLAGIRRKFKSSKS